MAANDAAAAAGRAGRFSHGVIVKHAALKERRLIPALTFSLPFLARAREGRAEPATSVSGATHIQVVSSATRDQTDPGSDPLAPPGRRLADVATSF